MGITLTLKSRFSEDILSEKVLILRVRKKMVKQRHTKLLASQKVSCIIIVFGRPGKHWEEYQEERCSSHRRYFTALPQIYLKMHTSHFFGGMC